MSIDEEEIARLVDRVAAMTEEDRIKILDPICLGLKPGSKVRCPGARVLPNRVIALACLDLYEAWNRTIWERD